MKQRGSGRDGCVDGWAYYHDGWTLELRVACMNEEEFGDLNHIKFFVLSFLSECLIFTALYERMPVGVCTTFFCVCK